MDAFGRLKAAETKDMFLAANALLRRLPASPQTRARIIKLCEDVHTDMKQVLFHPFEARDPKEDTVQGSANIEIREMFLAAGSCQDAMEHALKQLSLPSNDNIFAVHNQTSRRMGTVLHGYIAKKKLTQQERLQLALQPVTTHSNQQDPSMLDPIASLKATYGFLDPEQHSSPQPPSVYMDRSRAFPSEGMKGGDGEEREIIGRAHWLLLADIEREKRAKAQKTA